VCKVTKLINDGNNDEKLNDESHDEPLINNKDTFEKCELHKFRNFFVSTY